MSVGYDNIVPFMECILDLPMYEGIGTIVHDVSRPPATALDKTVTLTGAPTWEQMALTGITILRFDKANPDFLELAAADSTDLDFTTSEFTTMVWAYAFDIVDNMTLFCRGLLNTDGWTVAMLADGTLTMITNQAAATQLTISLTGEFVINTWYCFGLTREGANSKIFKNGIDVTSVAATHIDPLTSARKLHIGIYDDETTAPWSGYLYRPRIWPRTLTAYEMKQVFEMERNLFGI